MTDPKDRSFYEDFQALTQDIGIWGEPITLSAIATNGYIALGRGSVLIDRCKNLRLGLTPPFFVERAAIAQSLAEARRGPCLEAIDAYDPDRQAVIVVFSPISSDAEPILSDVGEQVWVSTFLVWLSVQGSGAGQRLAQQIERKAEAERSRRRRLRGFS